MEEKYRQRVKTCLYMACGAVVLQIIFMSSTRWLGGEAVSQERSAMYLALCWKMKGVNAFRTYNNCADFWVEPDGYSNHCRIPTQFDLEEYV